MSQFKQLQVTAIEHGGTVSGLMEYSWSDNPVPYDFFAKRDGTFNNTKIFKGTYGIIPEGPFVPLPEEIIDLEGVVKKNYFVEPLLRVQWVGEPVLKDDGTFEVQVKITRGYWIIRIISSLLRKHGCLLAR